jgi:hypothetical protein
MNLSIAHNSETIDPDPQNRGPEILKPVCFALGILGEKNNPIDCRRVKIYREQLISHGSYFANREKGQPILHANLRTGPGNKGQDNKNKAMIV